MCSRLFFPQSVHTGNDCSSLYNGPSLIRSIMKTKRHRKISNKNLLQYNRPRLEIEFFFYCTNKTPFLVYKIAFISKHNPLKPTISHKTSIKVTHVSKISILSTLLDFNSFHVTLITLVRFVLLNFTSYYFILLHLTLFHF